MRLLLALVLAALPVFAQDRAANYPDDTFLYAEFDANALVKGLPELDLAKALSDEKILAFLRPTLEKLGLDSKQPL